MALANGGPQEGVRTNGGLIRGEERRGGGGRGKGRDDFRAIEVKRHGHGERQISLWAELVDAPNAAEFVHGICEVRKV